MRAALAAQRVVEPWARIVHRGGPQTSVAPVAPARGRDRSRPGRVRRSPPRAPRSPAAPGRGSPPRQLRHPRGRPQPLRASASRSCSRPPSYPSRLGPRRQLKSVVGAVALAASAAPWRSGVAAHPPCEPVACSRYAGSDQFRRVLPARSTTLVVPPQPLPTKTPAAKTSRRAISVDRLESRRAITLASVADELLRRQRKTPPRRASTAIPLRAGKKRVVRRIFQRSNLGSFRSPTPARGARADASPGVHPALTR